MTHTLNDLWVQVFSSIVFKQLRGEPSLLCAIGLDISSLWILILNHCHHRFLDVLEYGVGKCRGRGDIWCNLMQLCFLSGFLYCCIAWTALLICSLTITFCLCVFVSQCIVILCCITWTALLICSLTISFWHCVASCVFSVYCFEFAVFAVLTVFAVFALLCSVLLSYIV